ncbi:uncharacterized protein [Centruroides vittatus]|uniref:uncharacterized protein isoform X2 n=1 Tax=Centruroides vittatus TaxID=120091 RepID=UPI00350F4D67
MYLEILVRNFAPKPKVATDIASKVWERVGEEDKHLQNHISKCMKKNVIIHSEDFPHEIFNMGKNKTQMMFTETQENDIDDNLKSQKKIIEDPEIFIRKWLIEGFVSVLKPLAAMFVWDQLFLDEWNEKSLQHVCFVLLGLLKPWFFIAKDYGGVREVFIKESSLLYTIDIRQGWKHVLNGGKFQDLADMNRNINANFSEPPESPPPPSKPKPVPAPVPVPVPVPIPDPSPKSPETRKEDCGNAWLPHKEQNSTTSIVPKLTDQFDFYIDSVRFTSDNSSIIKVTGKFINLYLGEKYPKTPEILAFPEINSPARNPEFDYKLTINREKQVMNPDALVLLRVYTIERHTEQIVIIGSCLIDVFCNIRGKPVQVNAEGHQIRLHRGLPSPEINVRHLESKHMDDNPNIPCATVLVRFMAHNEQDIPAPSYDTRYYKSHLSCPNESEKRVYRHYINDPEYRMTLTELASKLQIINSSNDDKAVMDSMKKKLSQKKGLEIPELPFERFIKYDKKYGVMIVADKASALPVYLEGRFFQCLTQIYPGRNGGEQIQSFLTQKQDLKCVQRSPDWLDPPKVLKLHYDERTVLIISLYGIRPTYVPPRDGKDAYLTHRGGNELIFTMEHSVAWGVVQCFDKGGVLAGIHLTPLFKGRVPKNIVEEFQYSPVEDVIRKNVKNLRFLVIKSYLRLTPHPQKYLKARVQCGGPPVQQLLLESLPSTVREDSRQFEEHKSKFEVLVREKFNILMNNALKEAGFSPLI